MIEINLALAYGRLGQSPEAEGQFRQRDGRRAFLVTRLLSYGQWLLTQNRAARAFADGIKAVALDP